MGVIVVLFLEESLSEISEGNSRKNLHPHYDLSLFYLQFEQQHIFSQASVAPTGSLSGIDAAVIAREAADRSVSAKSASVNCSFSERVHVARRLSQEANRAKQCSCCARFHLYCLLEKLS